MLQQCAVETNGSDYLSAYQPALRRYFRKRAPAHAVDDLVQEVFLSVYARQAATAIEDVERYLFTVASHAVQRKVRLERRWDSIEDRENWEPVEEISPERQVLAREQLANAVSTISTLPPRTRQVFLLHRFEEMTYRKIAESLGISVSAVEKHMIAALRALVRGAIG